MVKKERDAYIDAVRAIAIVRVVAFHVFRFGWMTVVFPSMGVMFALGGMLMARSMERSSRAAITTRMRRILPSLWLLAVLVIPLMLFPNPFDGDSWRPAGLSLLSWIVPLGRPEGSDNLGVAWQPLWYLRTYVWLVLLSPVLYWCFRRAPWLTLTTPLVLLLVMRNPAEVLAASPLPGVSLDLLVFVGCWLLGFAAHNGELMRMRTGTLIALATALGVAGLAIVVYAATTAPMLDLGDHPLANACWSIAFSAVILRFRPGARLLARVTMIHPALRTLSQRSLTIYLWHGLAIAVATTFLGAPVISSVVEASWTPSTAWWLLGATAVLTALAALTAGRLEKPRASSTGLTGK